MSFTLELALGLLLGLALGFVLGKQKRSSNPIIEKPVYNSKGIDNHRASVTRRDDLTLYAEEKEKER